MSSTDDPAALSNATSPALKALAVTFGVMSLPSIPAGAGAMEMEGVLRVAAATPGLVTAFAIWTGARWMFGAYCAWFVLGLSVHLWKDMQVESVPWKLAVGTAIPAAFWGLIGYWVFRTQQALALPDAE